MTKNKNPQLSVITVTYNNSDQIRSYFNSLKKYLFPKISSQLIIVDNNSQDKTVSILEDLAIKNRELTIFRNPQNKGFSVANNQAAKIASGKYLLFLNPDTQLIDSSVLKLIRQLEADPKIGLISPALINQKGQVQSSVYPPQTLKNAILEFFFKKKTFSQYAPSQRREVFALAGAAILIKKTLFDRLRGWNEKYFMYFEDLDLCRRTHRLAKKVVYYPRAQILHELGSSTKTIKKGQPYRWLKNSSLKYHGLLNYFLINLVIRFSTLCRNQTLLLLPLFVLALFLYFLISPLSAKGDLLVHFDWARSLYHQGLAGSYFRSGFLYGPPTQPPLMMLLFWVSAYLKENLYFLAQLHNQIHFPPTFLILWFSDHGFTAFLKLWAIIGNLLAAYLVYHLLPASTRKLKILAATFVLFNPLNLFLTTIWGQNDILSAFLACLSILPKKIRSSPFSLPLFLLSVLVKPTVLVLFPLYALLILTDILKQNQKLKTHLVGIVTSLLLLFLFLRPFTPPSVNFFSYQVSVLQNRIVTASKGSIKASVSAFNLHSLLFQIDKTPGSQKIGPITVDTLGSISAFLFSLTVFVYFLKKKSKNLPALVFLAYFLSEGYFLLAVTMLERYFIPALIPATLLLFLPQTKKKFKLLMLGQFLIWFLNLVYAYYYRDTHFINHLFRDYNYLFIRILSALNLFIFFRSCQLFFKNNAFQKTKIHHVS